MRAKYFLLSNPYGMVELVVVVVVVVLLGPVEVAELFLLRLLMDSADAKDPAREVANEPGVMAGGGIRSLPLDMMERYPFVSRLRADSAIPQLLMSDMRLKLERSIPNDEAEPAGVNDARR